MDQDEIDRRRGWSPATPQPKSRLGAAEREDSERGRASGVPAADGDCSERLAVSVRGASEAVNPLHPHQDAEVAALEAGASIYAGKGRKLSHPRSRSTGKRADLVPAEAAPVSPGSTRRQGQ